MHIATLSPRIAFAALCALAGLRALALEMDRAADPRRSFPAALDARFAPVIARLPERALVTFDARGWRPDPADPESIQRMTDAWLAARFALAPHHATLSPGADHVVGFYPDPSALPDAAPGPEHRVAFEDGAGLVLWSKR